MISPILRPHLASLYEKVYDLKGKSDARWYNTAAKVMNVVSSLGIIALMGYLQFGTGLSIWGFFGSAFGVSVLFSIPKSICLGKAMQIKENHRANKLFLKLQENQALPHHPTDLQVVDKRIYEHVRHADQLEKSAPDSVAAIRRNCDVHGIDFTRTARLHASHYASSKRLFSQKELASFKKEGKEFSKWLNRRKPADIETLKTNYRKVLEDTLDPVLRSPIQAELDRLNLIEPKQYAQNDNKVLHPEVHSYRRAQLDKVKMLIDKLTQSNHSDVKLFYHRREKLEQMVTSKKLSIVGSFICYKELIDRMEAAIAAMPVSKVEDLEQKAIVQHIKHFTKDKEFLVKLFDLLNTKYPQIFNPLVSDREMTIERFSDLWIRAPKNALSLKEVEDIVKEHDKTAPLYSKEITALSGRLSTDSQKKFLSKVDGVARLIANERVSSWKRLRRGLVRSFERSHVERFGATSDRTLTLVQKLMQKHSKHIFRTKMATIILINLVATTALGIACTLVPSAPLLLGACATLITLDYINSGIDHYLENKANKINKLRMVEYLRARKLRHSSVQNSFDRRVSSLHLDGYEPTQARLAFGAKPRLLHSPYLEFHEVYARLAEGMRGDKLIARAKEISSYIPKWQKQKLEPFLLNKNNI